MQFRVVILGILLLTGGVVAYSAIPAVQRIPIITTQTIMAENLMLPIKQSHAVAGDVNATTEQSELEVNVTVTVKPGESGFLRFELFQRNESYSCMTTEHETSLINREVSNETLSIASIRAGSYCFVFDNQFSMSDKQVSVSAVLLQQFEQVSVSRNGSANMAGLAVGAVGLLVFVYGLSRKTVIPWE